MFVSCEEWYEKYLGDSCNHDCENCYGDKNHVFAKDEIIIVGDMLVEHTIKKGERFWIHSESINSVILRQYDKFFYLPKDKFIKHFSYQEVEQEDDIDLDSLGQQPCEDVISRKSIKQKLQEHHDFFINAYGGFSNLPLNDKSRVDEITNCIAMVVNEPSITPQSKIGRCNDCKWWKDSDGVYRRGSQAESQCPINRKEVLEGKGYCYMFEQKIQEDEE